MTSVSELVYGGLGLTLLQEEWLAKHAVSEEDRMAAEAQAPTENVTSDDPMQGLEGLDVAGPRPV